MALALCGCQSTVEDPCQQLTLQLPEQPAIEIASAEVSRHNLRAWVAGLTDPVLGGRHAGTPGARAAAVWLAGEMKRLGLDPGAAGYCQGFSTYGEAPDFNVVGRLAGNEAAPRILLSAHYDGQGRHPNGRIFPGADDNASGIAALLEIARLVQQNRSGTAATGVDWTFIASGAEEIGQLGAREVLADASLAAANVTVAINLDMVGRRPGKTPRETQSAIGYLALGEGSQTLVSAIEQAARRATVDVIALDDFGDAKPAITDAHVFSQRLSTLLLSTALHEDHHRLSDTPDRLDFDQIARTVTLTLALADIIAHRS